MNARKLALVSLPAVLAAAAYVGVGHGKRSHHAAVQVRGQRGAGLVPRIRYRLALDEQAGLDGKPAVAITTRGTWTTVPRGDRLEVRYAAAELDGPRDVVPAADALAAPIELSRHDGVLDGIAFADGTPADARNFLTGLATTFQYSARDGAGWKVSEEDLSGRYDAVYVRRGGAVERSRPAYTALRKGDALAPVGADPVASDERSRFEVDADGIVRAQVAIDVSVPMGEGLPAAHLHVTGSLEREAIDWVPASRGAGLAMLPIREHVDVAAGAEAAARNLANSATVDSLLARALDVAGEDASDRHVRNQRVALLHQLAVKVRFDPAAAQAIADAIVAHAGDESATMLLAGALSSTKVAAGTDALAGLAGRALPDGAHEAVVDALSLSEPATDQGIDALAHAIDGAGGRQAALGVGIQGRAIRASEPSAADGATQTLLSRYASAADDGQRILYLQALGNAGDPAALPVLRQAIASGSPLVADAAIYSLRFLPGGEADDLLAGALESDAHALAAIRAVAFRDKGLWASRLAEVVARFPGDNGIQNAVQRVLASWA
ncbi:MAG TPA: HEAT repeat domain-containing protein [Kofleriaceae bacterium]|nr:HEAT repeat domain-containing protein [Kofleriaceae bacterium]